MLSIDTTFPPLTLNDRANRVRMLVLDVDGVLTDGSLTYGHDNVHDGALCSYEGKTFNTQDGLGIRLLQQSGIEVAIITGRASPMVQKRAEELGIRHLYQGRDDKLTALNELSQDSGTGLDQMAYCGDDLPDLAAIRSVMLGTSVANAPDYVRVHAHYVTERRGGEGAVRELADLLLQAQGHWSGIIARFIGNHSPTCPAG